MLVDIGTGSCETHALVSMNMEISCDVASLDAELLQLAEVSPLSIKSNPDFVEKLFEQWLSLPGTNRLVPFLF